MKRNIGYLFIVWSYSFIFLGLQGSDCDFRSLSYGLIEAIKQKNLDRVKDLIGQGASVNDMSGLDCSTPLMMACDPRIIQYLVEQAGADVNALNRLDNSVLHLAAQDGYEFKVTYLIEHGADVNAFNAHGETPLMVAVKSNKNIAVVKCLAQKVDLSVQNNREEIQNRTAVTYAKPNSQIERYLKKLKMVRQMFKNDLVDEREIRVKPHPDDYDETRLSVEDQKLSNEERYDKIINFFEQDDDYYWRGMLHKACFMWKQQDDGQPLIKILTQNNRAFLPQIISYFKNRETFKSIVKTLLMKAHAQQKDSLNQILRIEEYVDSERYAPDAGPVLREAIVQKIRSENL